MKIIPIGHKFYLVGISKRPVDVGIEAKYTWTLKLAMLFVEREFRKMFTERGRSKLLHRLEFSYTKATYTLESADPDEQETFRNKTFPALKKAYRQRNFLKLPMYSSCFSLSTAALPLRQYHRSAFFPCSVVSCLGSALCWASARQ